MKTVFLDAVFKPFFKIVHDTSQQLTIGRTNFLTDGFLHIIQRTEFVSVNTRFQISPKEKITRWKIGRARWPRHVSETGNEVPGKHVSNNGHWPSLHYYWSGQPRGKECRPSRLPPPTTEYYPFKRCHVPVGQPVQAAMTLRARSARH